MTERAMRWFLAGLIGAAMLSGGAQAAVVRDCDQTASAGNIVEPWEKNSKTFYNGQVRAALLDTGGEPACCSGHLLITVPPSDDEPGGGQTCFVISDHDNMGYGRVWFEKIAATYDAARGLLVTVPVTISNGDDVQKNAVVKVRVNIAKHSVAIER
jgi:hypothetical protein